MSNLDATAAGFVAYSDDSGGMVVDAKASLS